VIVTVLIWSLGDSMTTIDELRAHLPWLHDERSHWIGNEGSERFGLIAYGDVPLEAVARVRELIGHDPHVHDEFDVET